MVGTLISALAFVFLLPVAVHAQSPSTHRTEGLSHWESLRYGAFVHYNMNTYGPMLADGALDDYFGGDCLNADLFHPTHLDTAGWVRAFKEAGMQFAVLTTRHMGGFLLWDSATTRYSSVSSQYAHRDLVAEFVAECRRQGIEPGLYYLMGGGSRDTSSCPLENRRFDRAAVIAQLTELATHYGPIPYFWIDMMDWRPLPGEPGAISAQEIYDLLKKLQPQTIVHFNQHAQPGEWIHYFPTDVVNGEETLPHLGFSAEKNAMTLPTDPYSRATDDHGGYLTGSFYLPFEFSLTSQVSPDERVTTPVGFFHNTLWFTRGATTMENPRVIYPQVRAAFERGAARALLAAAPDESGAMKPADTEKLKILGNLIDARAGLGLERGATITRVEALGELLPGSAGGLHCRLTTGARALTVRKLGRFRALGAAGTHTLALVDDQGVELGRARVSLAPGNADLNGMVYGELERPVVLPPHSTVAIESYQAPAPDGYYPDARVGRNSKATFFDHCEGPLDLVADESDELALDLTDSRTRAELHGVRQNPGVGVVFEGHGYVAFENTGDLDSPGPMTIEAKIFPDRLDGIRTILAHGYTLAPKAEVSLRIRDGRYEAGSWNGASAELVSAPVPPADLHAWVELKVVFDGKNWQLFRNGKLLASKSARLGVLSIPAEWAVGGCSRGICAGGEERAFVGAIASVGITR